MHKLLVSVHWFVDQFAICSSWWQMIETNFHFWIQTQFILKDYCWNPQLVELVNLLPRTRRHWGWYFSFFLRLRQLKARRTTLNYKQRLYFPQELKRRGQKPGEQRRQTEAFLNIFLSGDPSLLSNNTCFWQFSSGDFKNINCLFPQYLLFPPLVGGSPVETEDKREILHKQTAEWELRGQGTGGQISRSRQNTPAAHCPYHFQTYEQLNTMIFQFGVTSAWNLFFWLNRHKVDRKSHIYINEIFIGCLTRFQFSFKSTL